MIKDCEITGSRQERITRGNSEPAIELAPGVVLREFASAKLGAIGLSTGMASFSPGACLPYHQHQCGESITLLKGEMEVTVEGRLYCLLPLDSIHIPAGVSHTVHCIGRTGLTVAHVAFSSSEVTRTPMNASFIPEDQRQLSPEPGPPESLSRFKHTSGYELSSNAVFRDLFARHLGSTGICGGHGRFAPGASLPCHTHQYDESITIVEGEATCLVAGRRYILSDCDTALVPEGLPHRFINESSAIMEMLWVYAGDEPERRIVDSKLCSEGWSSVPR